MFRHAAFALAALTFAGIAHAQTETSVEETATASAADLLRAQGGFLKSVQEARLLREEARQKALETSRKRIEHALYLESIRDTTPKMLARERAAELEHARRFASDTEIASGKSQPFQGARKFNGQLMLTHACAIIRQTLISTRLAGST